VFIKKLLVRQVLGVQYQVTGYLLAGNQKSDIRKLYFPDIAFQSKFSLSLSLFLLFSVPGSMQSPDSAFHLHYLHDNQQV